MYKRHVIVSLFVILLAAIASGIVSSMDPFGNNNPWASWAALSTLAALGSFGAVIVAVRFDGKADKEYFNELGGKLAFYALGGAILTGYVTTGVSDVYVGLCWAAFALSLVAFVLTSLFTYLVTASNQHEEAESLRRIA